jgi:hypothetical protein
MESLCSQKLVYFVKPLFDNNINACLKGFELAVAKQLTLVQYLVQLYK